LAIFGHSAISNLGSAFPDKPEPKALLAKERGVVAYGTVIGVTSAKPMVAILRMKGPVAEAGVCSWEVTSTFHF
jgi:hypothetical protein